MCSATEVELIDSVVLLMLLRGSYLGAGSRGMCCRIYSICV